MVNFTAFNINVLAICESDIPVGAQICVNITIMEIDYSV